MISAASLKTSTTATGIGVLRRRLLRAALAVVAVLAALSVPSPATGGASAQDPGCQEPFLPVFVGRTLYSARFGIPQVWPEHSVDAPGFDLYDRPPDVRLDTDGDGEIDAVRLGPAADAPVARWEITADRATITVDDGVTQRVFTTPPGVRSIPEGASVTAVRGDDGRLYLALIDMQFVVASPFEFRAFWDLEDPCRRLPRSEPEPAVCNTPLLPSHIAVPRSDGSFAQLWPPSGFADQPADRTNDFPVLELLDRDLDGVWDFYALPEVEPGRGRTTVDVALDDDAAWLIVVRDGWRRTYLTPDEVALPTERTVRFSVRRIDERLHLVLALYANPASDDPPSHEVLWDLEVPCPTAPPPTAPPRTAPQVPPAPRAVGVVARAGYTG